MKNIFCSALTFVTLTACDLSPPIATREHSANGATVIKGLIYHLPLSLIRVQSSEKTLSVFPAESIADPNARLVLDGRPRAGSKDDFDFTIQKGLLTSVKVDSLDQTPSIVNAALRGAQSAVRGEGVQPLAEREGGQDVVEFVFDPFDPNFGKPEGFKVDVEYLDPTLAARLERARPRTAGCMGEGRVCSGVETLVQVTVTDPKGTMVEHWMSVIDPTLTFAAKVERHACVNTTNALTITNGVVTQFDITKPSQVAGCLSIPLDVVSAIIAAPVDAITGRTARLTAEQQLLAQRAALLAQQKSVLDAEAALLAAQDKQGAGGE